MKVPMAQAAHRSEAIKFPLFLLFLRDKKLSAGLIRSVDVSAHASCLFSAAANTFLEKSSFIPFLFVRFAE